MDPLTNPYTPNAGAAPLALLGRDDYLTRFRILLKRLGAGRAEQSMIITGLRGVGKTVLLGEFRTVALDEGWIVIEQEISKHADDAFRRHIASKFRTALFELSPRVRWGDRMKRAAAVLKSFTVSVDAAGGMSAGLDVDAALGFADHGELALDMTDLFLAVGEAAKDAGKGVALIFDEIQFLSTEQLEALITALHKTVQRKLPVTLVGAGLPQIAELAGEAKSYSERLFAFPRIGHLEDEDARLALSRPAEDEGAAYDEPALELAVEVTGCYPYFIQELGYSVWGVAQNGRIARSDVVEALDAYQAKLDSSFFRVRLDRCNNSQVKYIRAMAKLGPEPQKAQDVADALGKKSSQVAPTRAGLISMGLLYTPEYGHAAFTVPHFDEFIARAYPE